MTTTPTTTLAVDLGGTQMRAGLIGDDGGVLLRRSRPTPRQAEVPGALTELIRSVVSDPPDGPPAPQRAVVGVPGPVDYRGGKLLWAPHLPETWPEQLTEARLAGEVGLPVRLANDADLAAVGEAYFGAGRDRGDVAYVTFSTGIGAGLVFDGHLVRADRSLAELGHTVIDRQAWAAGRPATLEELASGSGMTRLAYEAGLGALAGSRIEQLVTAGDPSAIAVWGAAVDAAVIGLLNLFMSFAPQIVVVGGGLGRRPLFFDRVAARVTSRAGHRLPPTPLVVASLGDDAGLVGAARWEAAVGAASH